MISVYLLLDLARLFFTQGVAHGLWRPLGFQPAVDTNNHPNHSTECSLLTHKQISKPLGFQPVVNTNNHPNHSTECSLLDANI